MKAQTIINKYGHVYGTNECDDIVYKFDSAKVAEKWLANNNITSYKNLVSENKVKHIENAIYKNTNTTTCKVLRVYDSNDKHSLYGNCDFAIIPNNIGAEYCYNENMLINMFVDRISEMQWQQYNEFVICEAEVEDENIFWCEILDGTNKECVVDCDKIKNAKYYTI